MQKCMAVVYGILHAMAIDLPCLCHELQVAKLSANGLSACCIAGDQEAKALCAAVQITPVLSQCHFTNEARRCKTVLCRHS